MVGVVINRCLQRRVYGLLAALLFFLPVHLLFLGMSLFSKPTHLVFELLVFLGFLTVMLSTTVGEGVLIIRPIADALAVCGVFASSQNLGQDMEAMGGGRSLSISLSAIGSDDDEDVVHRHGQMNQTELDTDIEFVTAMNTYDPVDPVGNFADQTRVSFPSPESPALPGKPLLSDAKKSFIPFL